MCALNLKHVRPESLCPPAGHGEREKAASVCSGVNWATGFGSCRGEIKRTIKPCLAATQPIEPAQKTWGKKRKTLVSFSAALHTDILRYAIVREAPAMLPYPSSKITPLRENFTEHKLLLDEKI